MADTDLRLLNLQVDVAGEKQVDETLVGMIRLVEDWSPAFERIGDSFRDHTGQVFATEGAANASGKWPSLSEKYAKWKEKNFPGHPILTREGHLRNALSEEGDSGHIEEISAQEMTIGGSRDRPDGFDLGLTHHEGRGNNPTRRIIALPGGIVTDWMQIIQEHMSWEKAA